MKFEHGKGGGGGGVLELASRRYASFVNQFSLGSFFKASALFLKPFDGTWEMTDQFKEWTPVWPSLLYFLGPSFMLH